ncbi:MAG TPA: cation transporting ATPase C-terminal domain-containing protein [Solimonas sp.]|nr:cation transporting ATPase C-terminal domain-containing protein [Solimonas sp.]
MPMDMELVFVALVAPNIGLIFLNRSYSASLLSALRRPNRALWQVLALTTLALSTVLLLPPVRELFRFALPPAAGLLAALLCGAAALILLEAAKGLLPTLRWTLS